MHSRFGLSNPLFDLFSQDMTEEERRQMNVQHLCMQKGVRLTWPIMHASRVSFEFFQIPVQVAVDETTSESINHSLSHLRLEFILPF